MLRLIFDTLDQKPVFAANAEIPTSQRNMTLFFAQKLLATDKIKKFLIDFAFGVHRGYPQDRETVDRCSPAIAIVSTARIEDCITNADRAFVAVD
jgi:hypothetical protein